MEELTLKVQQTAYPDGTTVKYLAGMKTPEVKNLGHLMKEATYNHILLNRVTPGAQIKNFAQS